MVGWDDAVGSPGGLPEFTAGKSENPNSRPRYQTCHPGQMQDKPRTGIPGVREICSIGYGGFEDQQFPCHKPLPALIWGMLQIPIMLPDLWQQEAVRALREGCDVIVDAPTGAGKTRVFELFVEKGTGLRGKQAVYTVPTRALANDKWREWTADGWKVGIATGDLARNLNAPVLVATLETQRERILSGNPPALLVIDEYQLVADVRRGLNYELAMALPPPSTQLLLLSGSVRNPGDLAAWLERLGRQVRVIRITERPVPLDDLGVHELPRVPDSIVGFWPRTAAGAIAARLSPLLIFAPRRREAEKIARQIAGALPADDPISLSPEDHQVLGADMAKLLQKRVAYHHSGLSYSVRADWVERLGKKGELKVIVATTGLAAGINFSVRSVMVASVKYSEGPYQRELRPDELLQMFGRAGRRGIDTQGHVIYAANTPRIFDGAPRQVRRVNQLDWPTLLRVMETAADQGQPPLERVAEVVSRLFSQQRLPLGFEHSHGAATADPDPRYGPTRKEILTPDQGWIPASGARVETAFLGQCMSCSKERWLPALGMAVIAEKHGPGRLCKLKQEGGGFVYGKEVILASLGNENLWVPASWIRKALKTRERFTKEQFEQVVVPMISNDWKPAEFREVVVHGRILAARLDLQKIPVEAIKVGDFALIDPPTRRVAVQNQTSYLLRDGSPWNPPPGSAAYWWRKLGLIEEDGRPSPRGRVVSRFQGGEGLMIAAALEDATYPVEDLVNHLANIRGGYRFHEFADGESQRLAMAARAQFGHVDVEGYLEAGLCPGFGEGTWEAMELYRSGGLRALGEDKGDISRGDLERASLEWKSLLRHVVHASDPGIERWGRFRECALKLLEDS